MINSQPFITGSRAYGEPRPDSDIDLVVRAPEEVIKKLVTVLGRHLSDYDGRSVSIKAGNLNLHLCHSDKGFEVWRRGTEALEEMAPVERERACRVFRRLGGDRTVCPLTPEQAAARHQMHANSRKGGGS